MNDLEHELVANLRRTRLAERRRARVLGIAACALIVPAWVGLEMSRGRDLRVLADLVWAAAPFGVLPAIVAASRLRKRWADRDVVDTSTTRERLCRDSPLPMIPNEASPWRRVVADAPFVVLAVAYCAWQVGWGGAAAERLGRAVLALGLGAGLALTRRAYEVWRTRRDARRELQSERWLDSADSCEVRPREWTK